jgi:hypothetical protein
VHSSGPAFTAHGSLDLTQEIQIQIQSFKAQSKINLEHQYGHSLTDHSQLYLNAEGVKLFESEKKIAPSHKPNPDWSIYFF